MACCTVLSASAGGLPPRLDRFDRRARGSRDGGRARTDVVGQGNQDRRREIAQFDGELHAPRDDVRRIRLDNKMADGADLASRPGGNRLPHGERQLRRRDQRVLAVRHRGRSCVVGEPGD